MFMIVYGIHCNFFIVLPIRLKTCRSNGFLQGKMSAPKKSGASQRFCTPERARSPLVYFKTFKSKDHCEKIELFITNNAQVIGSNNNFDYVRPRTSLVRPKLHLSEFKSLNIIEQELIEENISKESRRSAK